MKCWHARTARLLKGERERSSIRKSDDTSGLTPYSRGCVYPCLRVPQVTESVHGLFYLRQPRESIFSEARRAGAIGPGRRSSGSAGAEMGLVAGVGDGARSLAPPDPQLPSVGRADAHGAAAAGRR